MACWMTTLQHSFRSRERQSDHGRGAKQGVEAESCSIVNQLGFKEGRWTWREEEEEEESKSFAVAAARKLSLPLEKEKRVKGRSEFMGL